MAAIAVTSANSNSLVQAGRSTFRDSNGIPCVLSFYGTTIQIQRGCTTGNNVGSTGTQLYTGSNLQVGQSFAGNGKPLTAVAFKLAKVGTPTGTVQAKLYAHSGTFGTSSVPTGSPIASSTNTVSVAGFTIPFEDFQFTFATPPTLSNGTNYVIVLEYTSTSSNSSNYIQAIGNASSVVDGNGSTYNGTWSANANLDFRFAIFAGTANYFHDAQNALTSAGTILAGLSGAIDSTDIIHIAWLDDIGTSSDLKYATYNTATSKFSSITSVNADIGGDPYYYNLFSSICVDSNDKPHIAYTSFPSISGAATYTTWYTNKVSGSWSTNVQVDHVKNRLNYGMDISVDIDNIPVISVGTNVVANGTTVYRGNVNAATSFTQYIINTVNSTANTSICFAPNGDCYVMALDGVTSYDAKCWKHTYTDAWTTWTSMDLAFPVTTVRNQLPSLVWTGGKLHVIIEDGYDNDIKHASHDGTSWSSFTVLETGAFHSAKARWSLYNNNQEDNTESLNSSQTTDVLSTFETYDQLGWTFAGFDGRITKMIFKVSRTPTAITGQLYAKLYEISSISSLPTGTPLAISRNAEDVSTWTTTGTDKTWYFRDVEITSGKFYAIVMDTPALGGNQRINLHCGSSMMQTLPGYIVTNSSAYDSDAAFYLYAKPSSQVIDYIFNDETATPDIWWNTLSLTIPTSWLTKSLKWYNGSSWIAKPLKYYSGGSWVTKTVKRNM